MQRTYVACFIKLGKPIEWAIAVFDSHLVLAWVTIAVKDILYKPSKTAFEDVNSLKY